MVREISSGGAVVRWQNGNWRLAVIEPQSSQQHPSSAEPAGKPAPKKMARARKPVLALPKGLVDAGESPEQTALREVREETGLEARLITKLQDIRYVYVRSWGDGQRVFKIVSFYLLLYTGGKLGRLAPEMRIEVRRAAWLPLEKAAAQLSYRGEQQIARQAWEYVESHPELKNL